MPSSLHPHPPLSNSDLLTLFLNFRRQGSSRRTIEFYECCLRPFVQKYALTSAGINQFLGSLKCGNGKHGYYRAIRAFCNWLYRNDYVKYSPIDKVDPPKPARRILPSLSPEQVQCLVDRCANVRDKAIISLFADSGIRLNELIGITWEDIDFGDNTVRITGKGNKQRRAPFGKRTEELLRKLPTTEGSHVFDLSRRGVMIMLHRLGKSAGLPTNPHTFRRTFASNLHRAGLDVEHIMRLGGWESLDMVLRYTRSVKFEESLKVYRELEGENGSRDK